MSVYVCGQPSAILLPFNARAWSGTAVYQRASNQIILPTFAARGDGIYRDVLDFLNGRGTEASAEALPVDLAAAWTGAGTITISIDPTIGHIVLESDTEDFAILSHASNAWLGLSVDGHPEVGGSAPFRRVAPLPFQIGPYVNLSLGIDPAAAASFTVGTTRYWPDVVTALRERGSADADDRNATECLEEIDAAAISHDSVRWFLDEDLHIITAGRTGSVDTITWLDTTFRDRLGFSGLETIQAAGLVDYLRADYPMPGAILYPEGYDDYDLGYEQDASGKNLSAGGATSLKVAERWTISGSGVIYGPDRGGDLTRHWRRRVMPYMGPGRQGTFYPVWGDPRRFLEPGEVTADQVAHDLVYTTWLDGYRGRVEGHLSVGTPTATTVRYEGANARGLAQLGFAIAEEP